MKIGDRVIYDGCPCIIIRKFNSPTWDPIGHCFLDNKKINKYRLKPIKWHDEYPYLDTWVSEELLKIDYLYLRELKLKQIGI